MDSPPETPNQTPIYETLTLAPLSPETPTPSATTPTQSPPPTSPLHPYTVYRHEISLSLSSEPSGALSSSAPDFFSLDLEDEGAEPVTPEPQQKKKNKKAKKAEAELASALETRWFKGNSNFISPMLQLHKEIVDFCDFLSPTPEEEASRSVAISRVSSVIKYIWPHCQVEVFGSFRTGLYLPTSDIDVVILGSGVDNAQRGLRGLSNALCQRGIAKRMQVIAKARVPIVKFVENKSGVSFDISFDVQNGPVAAKFIKDAVSRWPALRPLCLILKVFLQQRGLNEVYTGGVGSYALLTMLMAMLKNLHEFQASPEQNLGLQLIHFFDFYGRKLNINDVGISCRGGTTFFPKRDKGFFNKGRPSLISIEDPQEPENDIGKNSYNYFQIRSAFAMAFSTLTNSKIILSLGTNRSILGTIIRPDPVLLERKGGSNGEVTFNSLLPGAGKPLESHHNEQSEILGNWRLDNTEEALQHDGFVDFARSSSGKKRKAFPKDRSGKKKFKVNGEVGKAKHIENGSSKKKRFKKHNY